MSEVQFWCLVVVGACFGVLVVQGAWYGWEDFKFRSRLREYQRTGTWTRRWWR